ncbi:MAG TPA: aquaporin [Hymenobacter sp.]|jgi:aquaporin Z|uniref:aquaporin n=1 Tax=Hymenobacter sp. TaxID=1898978 RepID=UPI002ED919BE
MSVITSHPPAARPHWPAYLTEAGGAACFVIGSGLATLLAEHPALPVAQALLGHAVARRAVTGVLVALLLCAMAYSPWGHRSGAHFNPAVTLGFWQLGRISGADALAYALAQVAGAATGAALLHLALASWLAHPAVHSLLTQPKPVPNGTLVAWLAEFIIAGGLMAVLLSALHSPAWHKAAGAFAATLLAFYIIVETPYSGMSLNPVRSLGTALAAKEFRGLWVYWTAPPLAMWLVAVGWKYRRGHSLARATQPGPAPVQYGAARPLHYPVFHAAD